MVLKHRTDDLEVIDALTLLFGIDPIVAMTDNSDIDRSQIPDALAWTARRLVEAALSESKR